tara:strand:- start:141 stop:524 length:384 start_codon:yes stop_codon:yes gene_type:complete
MAKKRITHIIEEFDISIEEAEEIIFKYLDESMITGKGKNRWINEDGQRIFDNVVAIPVIYRGQVVRLAPNPRFVLVRVTDLCKVILVQVKAYQQKRMMGKMVYIQADNSKNPPAYKIVRPTRNGEYV